MTNLLTKNSDIYLELISFLKNNKLYLKYLEDSDNWVLLIDHPEQALDTHCLLTACYSDTYGKDLIPIMRTYASDDLICIYNGKFYYIHTYTSLGHEVNSIHDTVEDLWEKVLKVDIDHWYEP